MALDLLFAVSQDRVTRQHCCCLAPSDGSRDDFESITQEYLCILFGDVAAGHLKGLKGEPESQTTSRNSRTRDFSKTVDHLRIFTDHFKNLIFESSEHFMKYRRIH